MYYTKKTLLLFTALGISTCSMAAYADPLDTDHFKAGTWQGTYTTYSTCDKNYTGKASLTVSQPVYVPPNAGGISSVSFVNNLKLVPTDANGPIPGSGISPAFGADGIATQGIISGPMAGAYSVILTQSNGFGYSDMSGYNPNTQEIDALGQSGNCKVYLTLLPQ